MATSLAQIINEIKAEVKRIGQRIANGVAQVAFQEMQDAHMAIMEDFYGGYTPVQSYTYYCYKNGILYSGRSHGYRRTGNLRNSLNPVGVTGSGTTYTATIQVGSAGMSDYINSTGHTFPGSAVFDMIWNDGIRGLPEGYRGHIGDINISTAPAGVPISGKPGEAMDQFVNEWVVIRAPEVADIIASGI